MVPYKVFKQNGQDMSEAIPDTLDESTDDFAIETVRALLQMIEQTDITELLIERGSSKLHLKRGNTVPAQQPAMPLALSIPPMASLGTSHAQHAVHYAPQPPVSHAPPYAAAHTETEPAESDIPSGHIVQSPMVGTFYAAPSPKDPPFVHEGDEVHVGDTVGIVEAMKMMNEIETEVSGRVVRILVQNQQPVEYGQPLMVIEPH